MANVILSDGLKSKLLVYLVYLVYLVNLVYLVYLVNLVYPGLPSLPFPVKISFLLFLYSL